MGHIEWQCDDVTVDDGDVVVDSGDVTVGDDRQWQYSDRLLCKSSSPAYVRTNIHVALDTMPIHIQSTNILNVWGQFASQRTCGGSLHLGEHCKWCALVVCSLKLIPITAMLTYILRFLLSKAAFMVGM